MEFLVVTHRKRLVHKYDSKRWDGIELALETYLDTLSQAGIYGEILFADSFVPIERNHEQVFEETRALKKAIKHRYDAQAIESLLFLGGDDIVPMFRCPDRTADQQYDGPVLSDSYYTDFDESDFGHSPRVAVGRLPDGGHTAETLLEDQLKRATAYHQDGGIPLPNDHAGFSADVWRSAAQRTYRRVDQNLKTLRFCPPLGLEKGGLVKEVIQPGDFPVGSVLYFNLHGAREEPRWFGAKKVGPLEVQRPDLVDRDLLATANLTGCVLFSEACYGATIHKRTTANSLPLCALRQGAAAFFGCTVKSYSVRFHQESVYMESGIDALFGHILHRVMYQRLPFGKAVKDTKDFFWLQSNSAYDDKNSLGLVLLGDPLLRFRTA